MQFLFRNTERLHPGESIQLRSLSVRTLLQHQQFFSSYIMHLASCIVHHAAWESLRCFSKFGTLLSSRGSIMRSSFSAAITSPLTWSSNVVHGAFCIGSRIIRSVRANCVVRVNEQEGYKKSTEGLPWCWSHPVDQTCKDD